MMGLPLEHCFAAYLGTADSPSGGRDFHYGDLARGVIQPVSHMGTSVAVAAGAALAFRNRAEDRVALTWTGDGATRTAAFHEGMVFAAKLAVPLVVIVQNNQVALGTTLEQHSGGRPRELPQAYGIEPLLCDGNNVVDMYAATAMARERCRAGEGPAVVVAETFRMGGHATHDEREARETFPAALFTEWGKRDPVGLFEAWLAERGMGEEALAAIEDEAARAGGGGRREGVGFARSDPGAATRTLRGRIRGRGAARTGRPSGRDRGALRTGNP